MMEIMASQTCGEEVGRTVVHNVEAPVAAQPGEQSLYDPPDPAGQKATVPGTAGRDQDVDVVLERRCGEGCAIEAAVAEQVALESEHGQSR
jgi:hypothetical protein